MARSYSAGTALDRVQLLLTEEDFGTLLKSTLKTDNPCSTTNLVHDKVLYHGQETRPGAGGWTLLYSAPPGDRTRLETVCRNQDRNAHQIVRTTARSSS